MPFTNRHDHIDPNNFSLAKPNVIPKSSFNGHKKSNFNPKISKLLSNPDSQERPLEVNKIIQLVTWVVSAKSSL